MKKSPLAKLSLVSVTMILLVAAPSVLGFSSLILPAAAGTSPSSGIELSPQPVYQREPSTSGVTAINQTHIASTFSAIGTFYEILEFPPGAGGANGIAIAVLHTNSTGTLAPLNGTILVGTDYLYPISEGFSTYWEWVPTPPMMPTTTAAAAAPPT